MIHRTLFEPKRGRFAFVVVLIALVGALSSCGHHAPNNQAEGKVAPSDFLILNGDGPRSSLDSQTVSGTITIGLSGRHGVTEAAYFLDEASMEDDPFASATAAPFILDLDTTLIPDGPHVIRVRLTYVQGGEELQDLVEVSFVVSNGKGEPALIVNAGPDLTAAVGKKVQLAGSVSMGANPEAQLKVLWSVIEGPSEPDFASTSTASTAVTFSSAGIYTLKLTAETEELSASDTLEVTVAAEVAANAPPSVDAGEDQEITLPSKATLTGVASDDGQPDGELHLRWTKVSGPGSVSFSDRRSGTTQASFSEAGVYVLRLSATDNELSVQDEVTVTVHAPASAPPQPAPVPPTPPTPPAPPAPPTQPSRNLELIGDPGFDVSALQPETRTWYNRFLNALNNPNQYPEINDRAATGDLYQLGRYVANDITTTLTIFRLTGDLRLLDHVDSVMQIARNQLKDYNGDGYPNWRWLFDRNETQYYNNDTHVMDELMTHGMIAQVAWTYHQNQDLPSPTGINYKERADFWTNYLQQWEAKWRKRNNKPTGFPFITKNTIHPYLNLIRYHWYTYRLTNNEAYLNEAIRLANDANTHEFRPITTPNGPGFVFSLGITKHDPQIDYLDPVHYAQYSALILLDLALEPFPTFTPETTLTQLANTIATKVIDNGSRDFAPSIGGTQPIGGLRMPDDTTRTPATRWAIYSLSAYSAYDTTNTIHTINQQVYERLENNPNNPTRTAIPAAMIIHDLLLHPGGEESN